MAGIKVWTRETEINFRFFALPITHIFLLIYCIIISINIAIHSFAVEFSNWWWWSEKGHWCESRGFFLSVLVVLNKIIIPINSCKLQDKREIGKTWYDCYYLVLFWCYIIWYLYITTVNPCSLYSICKVRIVMCCINLCRSLSSLKSPPIHKSCDACPSTGAFVTSCCCCCAGRYTQIKVNGMHCAKFMQRRRRRRDEPVLCVTVQYNIYLSSYISAAY